MFSVIAGKYESHEPNCKYSEEFESLDAAMSAYDKVRGYPWAYIQYKGRFLELFNDDFGMFKSV